MYTVSDTVDPELFPLFTPIANGISWVQMTGGARIGSTVLIEGPGPAGLGAVVAARAASADHSHQVGGRSRLQLAPELGATHTIVADQESVAERVRDITDGRMVELVVDATSGASTEPVELVLEVATEGATVVLAGMHAGSPAANFVPDKILLKALTIRVVWGRRREAVYAAIKLIEPGKFPLKKLCTHTFPLEAAGEALETVAGNINKSAVHVSVVPRT